MCKLSSVILALGKDFFHEKCILEVHFTLRQESIMDVPCMIRESTYGCVEMYV